MHDLADLEARGLVGVGVASDEFVQAAQMQARTLGYHPEMVFVPHPIQDRSDSEIWALADASIEQIISRLVSDSTKPS